MDQPAVSSAASTPQNSDMEAQLTSFTKFPKLPREIRDKIWMHAAFEPRKIRIFSTRFRYADSLIHRIPGQSTAPAILHTCQESREEGLRYYTKCDDTTFNPVNLPPPILNMNILYVNFAVDTFLHASLPGPPPFFTPGSLNISATGYNLEAQHIQQVQNLYIIYKSDFGGGWEINEFLKRLQALDEMTDLKLLTVGLKRGQADFTDEEESPQATMVAFDEVLDKLHPSIRTNAKVEYDLQPSKLISTYDSYRIIELESSDDEKPENDGSEAAEDDKMSAGSDLPMMARRWTI